MPRTKLDALSKPSRPPICWLHAAVLERATVLGYTRKRLAEVGGVSYDTMRHYITRSPWEWPRGLRERVCKELGVNITVTPSGIEIGGKKT